MMGSLQHRSAAEMIERGAPHVIHTEAELAEYTAQLFALTALEEPSFAEVEAIELLTLLVETYESKTFPIPAAKPAEVLQLLMESHGLTQSDLREEIGSQALVSLILRGKRQLTPSHMRALGLRFRVPAGVFL